MGFYLPLKHFCEGIFHSLSKYSVHAYLEHNIVGDEILLIRKKLVHRAVSKAGFEQPGGQIGSTC